MTYFDDEVEVEAVEPETSEAPAETEAEVSADATAETVSEEVSEQEQSDGSEEAA